MIGRLVLVANTLWVITTNVTKTSCLLQYARVLRPSAALQLDSRGMPGHTSDSVQRSHWSTVFHHRAWNDNLLLATYGLLICCLGPAMLYGVFAGVFLCRPVARLWDLRVQGTCADPGVYWRSVGGLDVALDFAVGLLPLPIIWKLRIECREKIALLGIWVLGIGYVHRVA